MTMAMMMPTMGMMMRRTRTMRVLLRFSITFSILTINYSVRTVRIRCTIRLMKFVLLEVELLRLSPVY